MGHIRDLPARAADVPEAYKRQWEILGIEVDNDFKPLYVVSADKTRPHPGPQEADEERHRALSRHG